ncbi:hypothetical protein DFH07DRAFT_816426 [Mycena maculata]|uniref:F-box domain-containing protein n=1 Tax=Mycena maculata TaxID=230809 RepID=A0AAD7NHX3_9AGAR|nr:hypothetical protein DFH07DRAFT_816426 [Mycena maculata]
MLLDLPVELLEEIGCKLTQIDHASLRAVCTALSGVMDRLFFSVLTLRICQLRSENGVNILRALATGTAGWSVYAKALRIVPGSRLETSKSQFVDLSDTEMHDLFVSALGTMRNIRITSWQILGNDPRWARNAICNYLGTLPCLDDLQLESTGIVDFSFPEFLHLSKFKIKGYHGWSYPSEQIYQVIAQSRLTSLHLDGPGEWADVWSRLYAETGSPRSIHLTDIHTRIITPDLFKYLASYSGIQRLTLNFPDGGSRNASNRLADTFFKTVLPRHASSLVELSCPAGYESRWSFGPHNLHAVSQLHELRSLGMSINAGELKRIPPSPTAVASGIGALRMGIDAQVVQSDIDRAVVLLLQAAAALPALRQLTILAADTESNRNVRGRNGIIHYTSAVTETIVVAVQNFSTNTPSPAIVNAGCRKYKLKPVGMDGTYTAKEGTSDAELLTYQEAEI